MLILSTVNAVNVPNDVIFVCAAVPNVPNIELALILPDAVI